MVIETYFSTAPSHRTYCSFRFIIFNVFSAHELRSFELLVDDSWTERPRPVSPCVPRGKVCKTHRLFHRPWHTHNPIKGGTACFYIYIYILIQWLWPSQIFLFLFLWKCAELPPKLDSRRGYFHIQLNPSREHFRPWPRSIPFCCTKVNKILEALQTRVDRILHSLKTGIHWDNGIYHDILIYIYIHLYTICKDVRGKLVWKVRKETCNERLPLVEELGGPLVSTISKWKGLGTFWVPQGSEKKEVLHVSHCFRTWMLPLRSNSESNF